MESSIMNTFYIAGAAIAAMIYFDPLALYLPLPAIGTFALEGAITGFLVPMVTRPKESSPNVVSNTGNDLQMRMAFFGAVGGAVAALTVSGNPMMRALVAAGVFYGIPYLITNF